MRVLLKKLMNEGSLKQMINFKVEKLGLKPNVIGFEEEIILLS